MRVLIGCEFSGIVRDAFIALGHEALSCDLLPAERPGPHYQGDVFDVIDYPWDLGIFHLERELTMTESSKELLESLRHYADHDETAPTWLVRAAADEIEQLRAAVVHAVEVIQTWHNMGVPRREQSDMWDIYWKNAPEMKPIRAALKSKELSS